MVPESKIIGEKEPPAGQMINIKEGQKAYSGKVIAVGKKKTDTESRLIEMEAVEDATNEMHGKYSVFVVYMYINLYVH